MSADEEFGFGGFGEEEPPSSPAPASPTAPAAVTMQQEAMTANETAVLGHAELSDFKFDDDEAEKAAAPSSGPARQRTISTNSSGPSSPTGVVRSVAASLNKYCQGVSQPFIAGADLMSDKQLSKLNGLSLTAVTVNVALTAPGSFSLSIYSQANGKGNLLAQEKGIEATSGFSQVTITFVNPAELEAGKMYHFLFALERGAFKFQAMPSVDSGLQITAFATQTKDWSPVALTFVFRSRYSKPLPQRGQLSGSLTVKIGQRGKGTMRRMSIKGNTSQQRFVVLEQGNQISVYKGIDGNVVAVIDPKSILGVDFVDAFDTVVFNIVTNDKVYQMTAASPVECKRWTTKLRSVLVFTQKDFGHAGNTNLLF